MTESPPDTMVEERQELMVSPTGGDPFLKKAYFLKPIVPSSSIDEPPFKLSDSSSSLPSHFEPRQWPLKVEFRGWRQSQNIWKTWVDQMASIHQSTWKKAGIYEPILNSKYQIRKNDLVYGLAEKWCPDTNTFIFPWGEATITLEDVMVLGGYSVLGDSVFSPLESTELQEIEDTLIEGLKELNKSLSKKASTSLWLKKFMNSGTEVEHQAFLAFWLSRYVFHKRDVIYRRVLPIAIHLARGTRIGLAPAVLASIYKDLSLLKRAVVDSSKLKVDDDDDLELNLWSPFQFVQVWAWERFLELSPQPKAISSGQPRLARWDDVNGLKVENLRMVLDSAGGEFKWRPYSLPIQNQNRDFPKYYPEEEMWVLVDSDLDDELLSFARCLKVSELAVLGGTIEQYLPHRVAMQFGFDQELPCFVARSNHSLDIVWQHYIKGIKNVELYIPSRLSEADVSTKYIEWWKQSMSGLKDTSEAAIRPKKKAKNMEVSLTRDHPPIPPGFPPKKALKGSKERNKINAATITCVSSPKNSEQIVHVSKGRNEGNHSLVPPGFQPQRNTMEAGDPTDEDRLTISQLLKCSKKHKKVWIRHDADSEKLGQVQNLASSIAEESAVNTLKSERLEKEVMLSEDLVKGSKRNQKKSMESNAGSPGNSMAGIVGNDYANFEPLFGKNSELQARFGIIGNDYANFGPLFGKNSELQARFERLQSVVERLEQMGSARNSQ